MFKKKTFLGEVFIFKGCRRLPPVTEGELQRQQLDSKSNPEHCQSIKVNLTQQSNKLELFTLMGTLCILDVATFIYSCCIQVFRLVC